MTHLRFPLLSVIPSEKQVILVLEDSFIKKGSQLLICIAASNYYFVALWLAVVSPNLCTTAKCRGFVSFNSNDTLNYPRCHHLVRYGFFDAFFEVDRRRTYPPKGFVGIMTGVTRKRRRKT